MLFCNHESAGKAKRDWVRLRVTALLNIPLCFWFVSSIIKLTGADYATFTTWLAQPLNAGLMILFILVTFYHAGLGVHEIVEDYVHEEGPKHTGLLIKKIVFIALGAVCIGSILKVAFA